MSSKISLPKICQHCNQPFIAKTTVTKYCSLQCAQKQYKLNKRNEKIVEAQKEEFDRSSGIDMKVLQSKEFLSIKETCLLLGISRMSLHRYIKGELISTVNLGGRVLVHRSAIDQHLKP